MKVSRAVLLFNDFVIIMAVYILILTTFRVLLPFYLPVLNKDFNLSIIATGEKNENSLGNNIRIGNISVNGEDLDLGKEPLTGEWKYSPVDDFVYVYNVVEPEEFSLQLREVHSIEITFISERGSGKARIQINGQDWKILDLFDNLEWGEKTVRYDTNSLVFPEKSKLGLLVVLTVGVIIVNVFQRIIRGRKRETIVGQAKALCGHYLLAISLVGFASVIQYHSISELVKYFSLSFDAAIKAIVLIFILLEFMYFVLGKTWRAYAAVSVPIIIFNILSVIKVENRGVPLLPWDYRMFFEAASVARNYQMTITFIEVSVIISVGIAAVVLALLNRKRKVSVKWKLRLGGSAVLAGMITIYISNSFLSADETTAQYRTYQVVQYYEKRGFITAFMEYLIDLNPAQEPEGYNKETLEDICNNMSVDSLKVASEKSNAPNIVVIMSESFWDIKRLNTLTFENEPLPVYEQLKKESLYGNLFTHVFGGGTVVSEFEFLTGFSGEFFPKDYMVYGNFLSPGFSSAVSMLENQGYQSLAIHPYISTNYNREKAYLNLGFDKSIFMEDFDEEVKQVRNYISDEAMYDMIIAEYEEAQDKEKQPMFIFAVTVQNHGGYWKDTIHNEGTLKFTADGYQTDTQECIIDYVMGLHEADRALGAFVDYFRKSEDTIIIYFGDHMSDAGPKNEKMLDKADWTNVSELDDDHKMHIVPFIAWSNFKDASKDMGIMEIGQLLPCVLEQYEMDMTHFWQFLIEKRKSYCATDQWLVIERNSNYIEKEKMSKEQKDVYKKYELLQYDYIWGKKYASELWEN